MMEKTLSSLEEVIVNEIIKFNSKKFSFLKEHVNFLRVKSRENTGVGQYIDFEYSSDAVLQALSAHGNACLSSDNPLKIDGLANELTYEINITDGKFDFLEIVANAETWDGNYKKFELIGSGGSGPN